MKGKRFISCMLAGMLAVTPITANAEEYEVMAEEEVFNAEEGLKPEKIAETEEVWESEEIQEIEEVLEPKEIVETEEVLDSEGDLETEGVLESEAAPETEGIVETEGVLESEVVLETEGPVESEGTMEPEESAESDGIAETEESWDIEEVWETEVDVANQDTELMSEENEEIESDLTEESSDESEQTESDIEESATQEDPLLIASGSLNESLTWSIDKNKVMRIEGTGEGPEIYDDNFTSILTEYTPETIILGDGITSVNFHGSEWEYKSIKTVIMADTITQFSFEECDSLENVTLPSQIKQIPINAFLGCKKLSKINLPDGLEGIDYSAFQNCTSLTEVVIPDSVVSYGDSVFNGCKSLERVVVSKNVTDLAGGIFSNCTNLKEVIIPEGVTGIYDAFSGSQITGTLILPRSIKYVSDEVYSIVEGNIMMPCHMALNKYSEVNLREDCTYYHEGGVTDFDEDNCSLCVRTGSCGDDATYKITLHGKTTISGRGGINRDLYFNFNRNNIRDDITELVIQNGIDCIEDWAFRGAMNLKTVELADSVKEIGTEAFTECPKLETVKIGKNLHTYIGDLFYGDTSLRSVTISQENLYFAVVNGVIFSKDLKRLIYYPPNMEGEEYDIPNGVTNIEAHAFTENQNLKKIVFPKSFVILDDDGLYELNLSNSPKLETVEIYGKWKYIPSNFATGCVSLKKIIMPQDVKSIGNHAFANCKMLKKVILPKKLKNIFKNAFVGCSGLSEIHYLGTMDEWKQINIASGNYYLDDATLHTYSCIQEVKTTCEKAGKKTYKCDICKDTFTENIPATGHSWNRYYTIDKESTCAASGSKSIHCRNCNAKNKVTALSKKPHTYKSVVTKATTKKNGKIVKKCEKCGYAGSSTVISYPKTIALSKTNTVYNGKVQKPSIVVKGADGKKIASSNYNVKYSGGYKNVGTYTITITFKGNYSGNVSKTFMILPKETAISKVAPVSKGFDIKWKKQNVQTTGYQIQYAANNQFTGAKTITVSKNATVSKKVTKLEANKKYYIRIRTYKTTGSKKYYSAWSAAKSVTTKK